MSCDRCKEVDLADYVAAPEAVALASFHAHVKRCAACAREVAVWRDMLGVLAARAPERHPPPALLLLFADAPERIDGDDGTRLAAHLAGCTTCADEVAALRSFAFDRLAPAAARGASSAAARPPRRDAADRAAGGLLDRLRGGLGGLAPRPAYGFAGAAVAVSLLAWLLATPGRDLGAPPAAPAPETRLAGAEPAPPAARDDAGAPAPAATAETAAAAPEVVAAAPTTAPDAPAEDRRVEPVPQVRPPVPPSSTTARGERAQRPGARDERAAPPAEDTALARVAPAPTVAAQDATTARADAIVDRFLGKDSAPGGPPAAAAGGAVDASALGFGNSADERGDAQAHVVALDASRSAVVPQSGRAVRLRVQAPDGSAADAALSLTLVAPDGSTSTVAASPRPGSPWREAQLGAQQLRERGRYTLRVSALDARGAPQSYDGVLEVR